MIKGIAIAGGAALAAIALMLVATDGIASPKKETPASTRSLVFIGLGAGLIDSSLSTGHLDEVDQHGDFVAAIEGGYARMLVGSWFSLTALGRYGVWQDGWAQVAGERRTRFDARLGPELHFPLAAPFSPVASLGLGGGATIARIVPSPSHRVTESFALGWGLNTGLRATFAARPFERHRIYVFADGALHVTSIRQRIAAPNGQRASELHRFVDRQLLLGCGYMLEL